MLLRALLSATLLATPAGATGVAFPGQPPSAGPSGSVMRFSPQAVSSYVGVFDVVGAQWHHYHSLRAGSAAIAAAGTQLLIRAVASNGGTPVTCDILVASNGGLGATSSGCSSGAGVAASTFCAQGGGSCSEVTIVYDQGSGAVNMTGFSNWPSLVFNCIGGTLPCLQTTNNNLAGTYTTQIQPFNLSLVAERTGNLAQFNTFFGNATVAIGMTSSSNTAFVSAGTVISAMPVNDNAWHSMQGTINGGSSAFNVDGTDITGQPGGAGTLTGAVSFGTSSAIGQMDEAGDFLPGTAASPAQRAAVCHNDNNYYGISGSC